MFKKYSIQRGPNIAFYEAQYGPGDCVTHGQGCGGTLVQIIPDYVAPRDTAGKVFCHNCGTKVGKRLTNALKRGSNREQECFYFPDQQKWDLVDLDFHEKGYDGRNYILRYWEFRQKEPEEVNSLINHIIGKTKKKLKKKPKRKVVPIGVNVTHQIDGGDYVLVHPTVTIRLARNIFTVQDLVSAKKVLQAPINVGLSKEGLVAAVMVELGVTAQDVQELEF